MQQLPDISFYQLLIANRANVTIEELSVACLQMQHFCKEDPENMGYFKLLEQLFLAYYEQAYPHTFGGIFEPLTKIIGYTHCHYLDPIKFQAFESNQFWLKFNIITNAIELLPDELQPQDIIEMVHMLHLMSYIKNRYCDKHAVSLSLANKDAMIGGVFAVNDGKLIISRGEGDHLPYGSKEYALAYSACDIIVHSWNMLPTLAKRKKLFADYLNLWGNEALEEIYLTEVKLPERRTYLKYHSPTFALGNYHEELKNEFSNIHFTRGIIKLQEATGGSREQTVTTYQTYLQEYLTQDDRFDHVFFIGNAQSEQHDPAFSTYSQQLRPLFRQRYGLFTDFSPDSTTPIPTPLDIIEQIISTVKSTPEKKYLIAIGLHGQQDGSATYAGGAFYKEGFQTLFDLASVYPTVQLFVMSCRSAKKTDKLLGNIIMSSSDQVSYATYSNYFYESFNKGESLYQAHIYAMTQYHQSLLPTSFRNGKQSSIELCSVGQEQNSRPI